MTRRRVPLIPVLHATAVIAAVTLVAVLAGCGGGGGAPASLRAVWRAYTVTPAAAGRAAFDRAATVRLLDRSGRERVLFGLEQLTPEGLAHDIRKLAR